MKNQSVYEAKLNFESPQAKPRQTRSWLATGVVSVSKDTLSRRSVAGPASCKAAPIADTSAASEAIALTRRLAAQATQLVDSY